MNVITKIVRSIRFALGGLWHAYTRDYSFRLEIWSMPVFVLIGYLLWPLSPWELIVFVFSYLLILITELINTSFEQMLQRLHPDIHEQIGISKDIASSAVLLAILFALVVVGVLILSRFGIYF